jgi:protein arginine N-methyltransferase 7
MAASSAGRYSDAELEDYDGSGEEGVSEREEYAQGYTQFSGRPYVPPASSASGTGPSFGENMESHFVVPRRLQDKPYELIEAANDWHYAMMNDIPRNEFYLSALRELVTPETVVLEIGAGSGLLSIIAASLGAKWVVAIEANFHLANVAREIIRSNGYEGRVHIINKMSTDVTPEELTPYGAPSILLSEILGTLLLGESALHYVSDARRRLCAPRCAVVPTRGAQFATLIEVREKKRGLAALAGECDGTQSLVCV